MYAGASRMVTANVVEGSGRQEAENKAGSGFSPPAKDPRPQVGISGSPEPSQAERLKKKNIS